MVRSARESGFALSELLVMVVVLGILSVVAVPAYVDLQKGARQSAEDAVVASVRTGILLAFAQSTVCGKPSFPPVLDDAEDGAASAQNPLFASVLQPDGVLKSWSKRADTYTGPTGARYRYDPSTGRFLRL